MSAEYPTMYLLISAVLSILSATLQKHASTGVITQGGKVAVILDESLTCEEMVKGVPVRLKGFHDGVHGCRFE